MLRALCGRFFFAGPIGSFSGLKSRNREAGLGLLGRRTAAAPVTNAILLFFMEQSAAASCSQPIASGFRATASSSAQVRPFSDDERAPRREDHAGGGAEPATAREQFFQADE